MRDGARKSWGRQPPFGRSCFDDLAGRYVQAGVLPPTDEVDALHVAIATVCEMDVLASWNQRHLANIRRRDLFNSVNRVAGYRKMLEIANPLEVLYE